MAPLEVLYGRRCHTPLNWVELGEKDIFGLDLVEEAVTIVCRIQDNMKSTKSRQETVTPTFCKNKIFVQIGVHIQL
jgi:hypothetical protein